MDTAIRPLTIAEKATAAALRSVRSNTIEPPPAGLSEEDAAEFKRRFEIALVRYSAEDGEGSA